MSAATPEPVSVVIPSYNGIDLLKEYLPQVKAALQAYAPGGEIVVIEDGGSDGSIAWLGSEHADVRGVAMETNRGFAAAANRGVSEAKNNIVVMLNNDMAPEGDFFTPLMKRLLSADDIFAATAKSVTADGGNESISMGEMDDGLIHLRQPGLATPDDFDKPVTLFHSAGGFSAYRRDRFLALGGFDPIYHPFYWEDVDLSYRAWRRGWRCVYEPLAVVKHRSHGTIAKLHKREFYDLILHSHLHLFHFINLEGEDLDRYLRRINTLMTEIHLYDNGVLRRAFYLALKRMDGIIERRKKIEPGRPLAEIIEASGLKPLGEV